MKNTYAGLLSLVLAAATAQADGLVEGDAEAGKNKAITCAAWAAGAVRRGCNEAAR